MGVRRFRGLEPSDLDEIREQRSEGHYIWIDLDLETTSKQEIHDRLGIPEWANDRALDVLCDFEANIPISRKFHADEHHVVFPYHCVRNPQADITERAVSLEPLQVHVLVHGEYMLSLSEEPFDLQRLVGDALPATRTEDYLVYAVVEAMTHTIFEALSTVEDAIEELEDGLVSSPQSNRKGRSEVMRGARARLTALRRRVGPQRAIFERVSEEISAVEGLSSDGRAYFERILAQLDRVVDGIDAASQALSNLLDLSLNEINYRLTVVATIFLPLTFLTGFFGMNFAFLVKHITGSAAFLILGVGLMVVSTAIAIFLIRRQDDLQGR